MKVVIIGTGYVGLVSAACFSKLGHNVACVDTCSDKVAILRRGDVPIYELGLEDLIKDSVSEGRLSFHQHMNEVPFTPELYLLAVGTPSSESGDVDMKYVEAAAADIADHLEQYALIINKSTVPVGTSERVTDIILKRQQTLSKDVAFEVVSNPEFLKEGTAVADCLEPDRVIVGAKSDKAFNLMRELYAPLYLDSEKYLEMSPREAEMTKYVANAMLATKISFINEIANICDKYDVDVEQVRHGISKDHRIGSAFINPGCGYGGSCFPKDVKALIALSKQVGFSPELLGAVERRNFLQKQVLFQKLKDSFQDDVAGKTVALLGLAFKPGTDDLREASAVEFIKVALEHGVTIKAYDPVAMEAARKQFPNEWFVDGKITLCENMKQTCADVDAIVIATEWPQFKQLESEQLSEMMKGKTIIDGRNIFDPATIRAQGLCYTGIGR